MSHFDYDVIVIGGGPAGVSAATTASALGARTLIIEREATLGGECLRYGCLPSKILTRVAEVYKIISHAQEYGLKVSPVESVDFSQVRARMKRSMDFLASEQSVEALKEKYNVDVIQGQASFVGEKVLVVNGKKLTSKNFIISTGTSPQVPDIQGLSEVPYLTNREIFSLEKLPSSMVVLGAGPHALEMAQSFARLGVKVTVVDKQHRLLPYEDADVAEFMTRRLKAEGVGIFLGVEVTDVCFERGHVKVAGLGQETHQEFQFEADQLFVATGRKINIEALGVEHIELEVEHNRILVDKFLRTNVAGVFAIGDVNGSFPMAHAAAHQGGVAALNAVSGRLRPLDYKSIPRVIYLSPEIATVGYNEIKAHAAGIDYTVQVEPFRLNQRAVIDGDEEGFLKLILKGDKPIGVVIVGAGASDLISEWGYVLNGQISLTRLANSAHPFPSRGLTSQAASNEVILTKRMDNPVSRWLGSL